MTRAKKVARSYQALAYLLSTHAHGKLYFFSRPILIISHFKHLDKMLDRSRRGENLAKKLEKLT